MNENDKFKRYEVFISSTYKDLQKERRVVMKTILDMGHFPSGMEEFPATDQDQIDYIKRIIDTADYYILILGGNIGSFYDTEKHISYTRMEYSYALEKNIPILVFVKSDEDGEPFISETDPDRKAAYQEFLDEAQKNRMRRSFTLAEELSGLVHHSLCEEIKAHPRYGWIRDYKPDIVSGNLLLRGRLLYYICIDRRIYDQTNSTATIDLSQLEVVLSYGPGTQGVFVLACSPDGHSFHNSYYDLEPEEINCFDDDGDLGPGYIVQLSFAKMDNIDEPLLFLSVGDGQIEMMTKVFCIDKHDFKYIGVVRGQEFMYVDYSLETPFGSQGLYDSYVFCDGEIMRAEWLDELHIVNSDNTNRNL